MFKNDNRMLMICTDIEKYNGSVGIELLRRVPKENVS